MKRQLYSIKTKSLQCNYLCILNKTILLQNIIYILCSSPKNVYLGNKPKQHFRKGKSKLNLVKQNLVFNFVYEISNKIKYIYISIIYVFRVV